MKRPSGCDESVQFDKEFEEFEEFEEEEEEDKGRVVDVRLNELIGF